MGASQFHRILPNYAQTWETESAEHTGVIRVIKTIDFNSNDTTARFESGIFALANYLEPRHEKGRWLQSKRARFDLLAFLWRQLVHGDL